VSTLPAISDSLVPADVRKAGDTNLYKSALGFESMLLDNLSETLVKDSGMASSPYSGQLTGAFSQSLLQGGGVGLADQLYKSLRLQAGGTDK
jgi:Rod binding domain-containing protein